MWTRPRVSSTPPSRGRIRVLIGDTGYDAERIRAYAAERGMKVVIPPHPTHAVIHRFDKPLYRTRYRVECLFHPLKRCRRIATRYEKGSRNDLARVHLGRALIWLDQLADQSRHNLGGTAS